MKYKLVYDKNNELENYQMNYLQAMGITIKCGEYVGIRNNTDCYRANFSRGYSYIDVVKGTYLRKPVWNLIETGNEKNTITIGDQVIFLLTSDGLKKWLIDRKREENKLTITFESINGVITVLNIILYENAIYASLACMIHGNIEGYRTDIEIPRNDSYCKPEEYIQELKSKFNISRFKELIDISDLNEFENEVCIIKAMTDDPIVTGTIGEFIGRLGIKKSSDVKQKKSSLF